MIKDKEYYEVLDKRTNEFKEWKKSQTIEPHLTQEDLNAKHEENPTIETGGIGDVVEKITKATGIKALVDWFTPEGEDCGCDERQTKLNKYPVLKNKHKVECLTLDEYKFLDMKLSTRQPITGEESKRMVTIYERVFNVKLLGDCVGCSFGKKLDELKAVLDTYK